MFVKLIGEIMFANNKLDKITSSVRKQISKKLYAEHGVRTPVKKFNDAKYGAKQCFIHEHSLLITVRWYPVGTSNLEFDEYCDPIIKSWEVSISIETIDTDDVSTEYHPFHEWFIRGCNDGYADGWWQIPNDPTPTTPPSFSSPEAEKVYWIGYKNGLANGMMDE